MAIGDIIVGIDIGTSKVASVIAEINNFNQLEIIATAECKCFGMKKSKITDEDEIASAIGKTISEVENQGNIKTGREANLTVIDVNEEWIMDASKFKSKCRISPFDKMKLKGKVKHTIIKGKIYNIG